MKGPIDWFARNSVAANLLMLLILVGGLFTVFTIKREVFPEFSLDLITVREDTHVVFGGSTLRGA